MLAIARGTAYAFFAFEVGRAIDLEEAHRRLGSGTERAQLRHRRRAPRDFEFRPAPLRVFRELEPLPVGRFASAPVLDSVLYDFGAISISFAEIASLADAIADHSALAEDARRRLGELVEALGAAVRRPAVRDVVETYVVIHVDEFTAPLAPADLVSTSAADVAHLLRGADEPLSAEEIADATARRASFGTEDVTFIDWDGALVVDRTPEDVLTVLEFANVELVEMRFLDQRLDDALDQSYEMLAERRLARFWRPGFADAELRALGELQVENALLFEGVNNALKLVGDQFLARVYRAASDRFHMAEWDATILRKLETLDSLYVKMSDLANAVRLEALEWVIIALIAFEVAWALARGG
jgi:hypothetical protein